jgi:hypothetical protein
LRIARISQVQVERPNMQASFGGGRRIEVKQRRHEAANDDSLTH